jgi:hypothetical protein
MGYYLVFRIRQIELKAEVKTYLKTHTNDHHLTHFQFVVLNGQVQDSRLNWEDEDEFELSGNMYDVIGKSIKGDTLIIHCLKDEKENSLVKSFEHLQNSQSRDGKNKSASLLQFFGNLYVATELDSVPEIIIPELTSFNCYNPLLINRSSEILTPPPKNC